MLGFPNRIDEATLSNGSWTTGLPRSFLQSRIIGKVARTTDAALTSTKLDIDLTKAQKIQLLALRNHNLSINSKYRITAANDNAFATPVYASGWLDVWPVVYPYGVLEWEDDNFWTGKYSTEEMTGYVTELDHILPTWCLARYWRIEINDTANLAGYIQIGRPFIGPAWQPTINMTYGESFAWETKTEVQEAISGAEYFQPRLPFRVHRFSLDWMSQDEAFSRAFEIMRRAGIDKEILFIFDPADTVHALRRRFMGRLRTLSPIENPYINLHKSAFEAKEIL